MYSPLAQFDVISIIPLILRDIELSLTNLSLTIIIAVVLILALTIIVMNNSKLIPNSWQLFMEQIFIFVYRLVFQQMGNQGIIYFPLIFSLFLFILVLNLLGLIPLGFAVTSHLIWTLYFALSLCLGIFLQEMLITHSLFKF